MQAAYDYFSARSPNGGDELSDRYFATTNRIERNPETFPLKFDDYRRALVPRSYLAVYYFVETDRSVIAAMIDARRHPRLIRDMVRVRR